MRVVLSDREAEIMQVLWERGPSTVTEVREQLKDELAYTTVLTMLRNLEAKEYVGPTKDGRAHRYAPLITSENARRSALRDLSEKLFKGSAELLLTHFVADQKLNDVEIERIQKMLADRRKKDKAPKGAKK
jgi:predicted transcriptional regulator